MIKKLFLFWLIVLFFPACTSHPRFTTVREATEEETKIENKEETKKEKVENKELFIKVGLLENVKSVKLSSQENLEIYAEGIKIQSPRKDFSIIYSGGKFSFNEKIISDKTLIITTSNSPILVNSKSYGGKIILKPVDENVFNVIEKVELERYLKGVVPSEIPSTDKKNFEAIKAQAVAARTYALKNIGKHKNLGIDVWASVKDQVYNGLSGEAELSNKAVEETEGLVISYEGKVQDIFFFSTCGGKTENNSELWSGEQKPHLTTISDAKDDGDFCKISPHHRWQKEFSRTELQQILEANLETSKGELYNIKILNRTQSGRIKTLQLIFRDGTVELKQSEIRNAFKVNEKILPSTLFRADLFFDANNWIEKIVLVGAGNGHGVGLCQFGAIGMAKKGFKFEEILLHYFKGTKILPYKKLDTVS
ncbi:SpoIID/LytB domain-containing protein [bacterium]|nr:SpoIID/LytB domain-containing protein [bacterium]